MATNETENAIDDSLLDKEEIEPDVPLEGEDEDNQDDVLQPKRFVVSSYGWDSDVEGLVKRLDRGDIYAPGFQRKFVWARPEKSRFIESLILGLPVPTLFLAQDAETKKLNIVDGQQRLKTLQQYLNGEFSLAGSGIPDDLKGRYYSAEKAPGKNPKVLNEVDARALADSLVHSVVIKPDPSDDDPDKGREYNRAIIQIFYRLNTSGKALQPQEIRASIFHGEFDAMLRRMNNVDAWRKIFGNEHGRLKDVEAILRYLALLENGVNYKSPMPQFLDRFMEENRHIGAEAQVERESEFKTAIGLVLDARGATAFKRGGTFLLSRFDAMMVGAVNGMRGGKKGKDWLNERWDRLEADKDYQWSVAEFVNDTNRVTKRLERAISIFTA